MGLKILDDNNKLIYEFDDDGILLSGLITRAKFGEQYQSEVTFNQWVNDLLAALMETQKPMKDAFGKPISEYANPSKAPKYYADSGMTDSDYDLRYFFQEFTMRIASDLAMLSRWNWRDCGRHRRHELIRIGLFPHPISDARLDEMISDIDLSLKSAVTVYNPTYSKNE